MSSDSASGASRLLSMALGDVEQVKEKDRDIRMDSRSRSRSRDRRSRDRYDRYRDRSRDRGTRYVSSSHRDRRSPKYVVKVSNLDHTVTREQLKALFSEAGEIERAWIDYDRTARSKGTGGCIFKSIDDGKAAVSRFNGHEIAGRIIEVTGDYQDKSASRPHFRRQNRNKHCVKAPW